MLLLLNKMDLGGIFTKSALGPLWSSSRDVCFSVCPLPMQFSQGSKGGSHECSPVVLS